MRELVASTNTIYTYTYTHPPIPILIIRHGRSCAKLFSKRKRDDGSCLLDNTGIKIPKQCADVRTRQKHNAHTFTHGRSRRPFTARTREIIYTKELERAPPECEDSDTTKENVLRQRSAGIEWSKYMEHIYTNARHKPFPVYTRTRFVITKPSHCIIADVGGCVFGGCGCCKTKTVHSADIK